MKRDIRIKVIENPTPDFSKLARALLLLVAQQDKEAEEAPPEAKSA